jgi:phenylacetate-coenzyme A ligase PaaK-like adenylate-forming protein
MQCEAGAFHQNTATCYVDIQPLWTGRGDSKIGRILVTTLDNPWCVLLRFDVGDIGCIRTDKQCTCGRADGIVLNSIEGRCRDITFDSENRVVTLKRLDDALGEAEGLVNYHLEQLEPKRYKMRYAAEPREERYTADILPDILHKVYGKDALVEVAPDSALPPEQSGKFRLAHTALDFQPEELFK